MRMLLQPTDGLTPVCQWFRSWSQINTADEVLVTELILEGVFNELEPDELVALLSAFVFEERSDNEPVLTERLDAVHKAVFSGG